VVRREREAVTLEINDDGPGVRRPAAEDLRPFFTTKEVEKAPAWG